MLWPQFSHNTLT